MDQESATIGSRAGGRPNAEGPHLEAFDRLKKLVTEVEEDLRKAEGGNKAAGTRVRQTMQDIKNTAQEIRQKILDLRGTGEDAAKDAKDAGKGQ